MTPDIDRKRIEDTGERARRVIADLEYLAVAGATQHEKQVDLLKKETERLQADVDEANRRIFAAAAVGREGDVEVARQIAALKDELAEAYSRLAIAENTIALKPDEPPDMTINLDDIRAVLAEAGQDNPAVGALLVSDSDDEVQVVDSIHALVGHIADLTGGQLADADRIARLSSDLKNTIQAATDNEQAAARWVEEQAALKQAVTRLVDALMPLDSSSAKLARVANPVSAIIVVAGAITDVVAELLDDDTAAKAVVAARADADRIEDEIHAIEAACATAGMAATVERRDIPAWLAANLKPRATPKVKAAPFVVMRNDANGRRFWAYDITRNSDSLHVGEGPGWDRLPHAVQYDTVEAATTAKPRGSKVVGIVEAMRLIENDARIAASAELPMASEGGAE